MNLKNLETLEFSNNNFITKVPSSAIKDKKKIYAYLSTLKQPSVLIYYTPIGIVATTRRDIDAPVHPLYDLLSSIEDIACIVLSY